MLICVGVPVIDGKPYAQLVDSLLAEQIRALGQGDHILVLWKVGCSLIGVARNRIAADFIGIPQAECLVFVDADISWKCGDLLKLAHSGQEVIGATYRAKEEAERYHVFGDVEPDGDLYRVGGLPGGFMKISRRAFQQIKANQYRDREGTVCNDWFPTGFHNGVMYGEDYGFCRLYRESGGTVWLDPSIKLKHWDGGRCFTGDPAEWLKSNEP